MEMWRSTWHDYDTRAFKNETSVVEALNGVSYNVVTMFNETHVIIYTSDESVNIQ